MGRPKGSTNKKSIDEEKKTENVNIEEMIQKAVSQALSENEKKHKKEIEELKSKLESKDKKDIRFNDIMIEITNNTHGAFVIGSKRGNITTRVLKDFEDNTLMDYKEFRMYYSENRRFFKRGELLITDVIGDLDLKQIYDKLKIKDFNEGYDFETYEELLLGKYNDFEKFLKDNDDCLDNMLDHAMHLYKQGKFNFNDKINFFRAKTRNYDLFK